MYVFDGPTIFCLSYNQWGLSLKQHYSQKRFRKRVSGSVNTHLLHQNPQAFGVCSEQIDSFSYLNNMNYAQIGALMQET